MRARPVVRRSRLAKNRLNRPMNHAGVFVDGIQIAVIAMAVGALGRTFKTWDRLLSEVHEQLKPPAL